MDSDEKKVLVPIANEIDALEAVVLIDVLRRANDDVTVASVENELQINSSNGVKIVADTKIAECENTVFNLIALPILVPIAEGSDEMEVVTITDVLRRAGAEVVVASICGRFKIEASHNVKPIPDMTLDEVVEKSFDLIVLPGDLAKFTDVFRRLETLSKLLKTQNNDNKPYGGICGLSTIMIFQNYGLLEGKKATASKYCIWLGDSYYPGNRVVIDGNVATSQAAGTAMEFALVIVEKFCGREKAIELGQDMIFC